MWTIWSSMEFGRLSTDIPWENKSSDSYKTYKRKQQNRQTGKQKQQNRQKKQKTDKLKQQWRPTKQQNRQRNNKTDKRNNKTDKRNYKTDKRNNKTDKRKQQNRQTGACCGWGCGEGGSQSPGRPPKPQAPPRRGAAPANKLVINKTWSLPSGWSPGHLCRYVGQYLPIQVAKKRKDKLIFFKVNICSLSIQ